MALVFSEHKVLYLLEELNYITKTFNLIILNPILFHFIWQKQNVCYFAIFSTVMLFYPLKFINREKFSSNKVWWEGTCEVARLGKTFEISTDDSWSSAHQLARLSHTRTLDLAFWYYCFANHHMENSIYFQSRSDSRVSVVSSSVRPFVRNANSKRLN